jgi:hypothetical protein
VKYRATSATSSSLPTSPVPRLSPQGTLKMLASLTLRRLFSNSESCAAPCYALLRAARVGVLLQQAAAQGSAPTAVPEAEAASCVRRPTSHAAQPCGPPAHYEAYKYPGRICVAASSLPVKIMILLVVLGCGSGSGYQRDDTSSGTAPPHRLR